MGKNKYVYRSRISEAKFREVVKYFCLDLEATKISELTGLSRISVNKYMREIRRKIGEYSQQEAQFSGEVEIDESYFGAKRVRGKRGRGAAGKTPVFGILKRNGKVFVTIVKNCSKAELLPILQGKVLEGSTIHSDRWRAYDGLILNGYDHYRVHHEANEFVRGKSHINGIESFWSYAKRRLSKFNGIPAHTFHLHLKECEFRWNSKSENLYAKLLSILRKNPLKLS